MLHPLSLIDSLFAIKSIKTKLFDSYFHFWEFIAIFFSVLWFPKMLGICSEPFFIAVMNSPFFAKENFIDVCSVKKYALISHLFIIWSETAESQINIISLLISASHCWIPRTHEKLEFSVCLNWTVCTVYFPCIGFSNIWMTFNLLSYVYGCINESLANVLGVFVKTRWNIYQNNNNNLYSQRLFNCRKLYEFL